MELLTVPIEKPQDVNLILGQAHFIKTVEDLHEALVGAVPGIQFGVGFCESSGPALVRASGSSPACASDTIRAETGSMAEGQSRMTSRTMRGSTAATP